MSLFVCEYVSECVFLHLVWLSVSGDLIRDLLNMNLFWRHTRQKWHTSPLKHEAMWSWSECWALLASRPDVASQTERKTVLGWTLVCVCVWFAILMIHWTTCSPNTCVEAAEMNLCSKITASHTDCAVRCRRAQINTCPHSCADQNKHPEHWDSNLLKPTRDLHQQSSEPHTAPLEQFSIF